MKFFKKCITILYKKWFNLAILGHIQQCELFETLKQFFLTVPTYISLNSKSCFENVNSINANSGDKKFEKKKNHKLIEKLFGNLIKIQNE
ncbi:hypothetical protein BpHYR1_038226 [Brachionus plicatilis]|uniref:Uncharacterized protein n=1 Tax=Brachionus plicatilis TaxID=10195 RepID=A0A3M7SJ35_BRAPC|nr:hypothetical protein BpHYR1_038226 [Brachionus plicatilis]